MKPEVALKLRNDAQKAIRAYTADILNAQNILTNNDVIRSISRDQEELLTRLLTEFIEGREIDLKEAEDDVAFLTRIAKQGED